MCTEVISLQPAQIDAATTMLGSAFNEDPAIRYLINEEAARTNVIKGLHKSLLYYCQPYNQIYTTPGDLKGVAAWIPPGHFPLNLLRLLQAGFYKLPFQVGLSRLPRWLEVFKLEQYHHQDMPQPHWYLMLLGVAPTYQRQGIGSLLLQPVLKQADHEGLPCYLETSTEAAVRFYQKHGFEIVRRSQELTDTARFWTMKREPHKEIRN